ncbi:hypothetical protein DERF_015005 [Dermatophagoides farinae]|uniref:Uncharacterized protein n=1 Tax=Dermatophagoides farinae TaxID=6954 RepID=A0A922KZU2_DERFA|nr:hypothetical protein DERF_015005 [Dermatophagoides farinae]
MKKLIDESIIVVYKYTTINAYRMKCLNNIFKSTSRYIPSSSSSSSSSIIIIIDHHHHHHRHQQQRKKGHHQL